jgi:hypothetical protein
MVILSASRISSRSGIIKIRNNLKSWVRVPRATTQAQFAVPREAVTGGSMNMEDKQETLDSEQMESLGGTFARAVLWAVVFLELLIIYGVREPRAEKKMDSRTYMLTQQAYYDGIYDAKYGNIPENE